MIWEYETLHELRAIEYKYLKAHGQIVMGEMGIGSKA